MLLIRTFCKVSMKSVINAYIVYILMWMVTHTRNYILNSSPGKKCYFSCFNTMYTYFIEYMTLLFKKCPFANLWTRFFKLKQVFHKLCGNVSVLSRITANNYLCQESLKKNVTSFIKHFSSKPQLCTCTRYE